MGQPAYRHFFEACASLDSLSVCVVEGRHQARLDWKGKMDSQTIARIFGALYLATFVTSIAALLLFQPVLDDPAGYVANGGSDNRIFFGALLELLLIITNIGTAVVIYSIVRRQNHVLALASV